MSSSTSPTLPTASVPAVLIHVVSQNPEVPGRLVFSSVPIDETIADLKRRIQAEIPGQAPLERQRIIYRGRAMIYPEQKLQAILGPEVSRTARSRTYNQHVAGSVNRGSAVHFSYCP